jgi:hypothetical protein
MCMCVMRGLAVVGLKRRSAESSGGRRSQAAVDGVRRWSACSVVLWRRFWMGYWGHSRRNGGMRGCLRFGLVMISLSGGALPWRQPRRGTNWGMACMGGVRGGEGVGAGCLGGWHVFGKQKDIRYVSRTTLYHVCCVASIPDGLFNVGCRCCWESSQDGSLMGTCWGPRLCPYCGVLIVASSFWRPKI